MTTDSSTSTSTAARQRKPLTGRVPAEAIHVLDIPRLAPEVLEQFRELEDLSSAVSDAMDNLGLFGAVPAAVLPCTLPSASLVGQAVTVRNVPREGGVAASVQDGRNMMGEQEAYNLASPGDVVVIQGILGASNMGGQSATLAHRAGCAGAVIDGSYRDPDVSVNLNLPIWSRGVTPVTGKWRLRTEGINGPVLIAGITVNAGDLVVADAAGVVFVPFARVAEVLAEARRIDAGDNRQKADIAQGVSLSQLAKTKYK
jgi:regulator of RNase E activity RraA